MDTGPVLGLSEVRAPFLVDLLDPRRRETEASHRAAGIAALPLSAMPPFDLEDDVDDDDLDEDDDFDEDDEDSDEDEDDADDEGETWQVDRTRNSAKGQPPLDFPALNCLDWREFPSSASWDASAGAHPDSVAPFSRSPEPAGSRGRRIPRGSERRAWVCQTALSLGS